MTAAPLTAGFPATTATSLATLGTGRPPGQHGLLGYQVAVPGTGKLLNALRWDASVDPLAWQPGSTIFERAAAAGVVAFRVAPGRVPQVRPVRRGDARSGVPGRATRSAPWSRAALQRSPGRHPAFAMVYYGDLDATGHALGCTSDAWQYQLAHVDKLAEQLAAALPHGTALYVTADHGMIDVPAADRIDVDQRARAARRRRPARRRAAGQAPVLQAGRGRRRARDLDARCSATGPGWSARSRRSPMAGSGRSTTRSPGRIGDVIVAPSGPGAIVATRAEPRESALVGMHGSLTQADQLVPLLTVAGELTTTTKVCPQAAAGTAPPLAWLCTRSGRLSTVTGFSARPLISVAELAGLLGSARPPAVLDVRWRLGGPPGIECLPGRPPAGRGLRRPGRRARGPPDPARADAIRCQQRGVFEAAMRAAGVQTAGWPSPTTTSARRSRRGSGGCCATSARPASPCSTAA